MSHLLTRMEGRDLVERREEGAPGRRTAVTLSLHGQTVLKGALRVHEESVGRVFFDHLTSDEAGAIRSWSEKLSLPPRQRPDQQRAEGSAFPGVRPVKEPEGAR
ncbi:hypothetical protein [Frondihabitans sp. PAMC 28766]|uniref:hypothetical protein n=1 Tax=Frondihabitans sp. PAMC 28766 TaxID=1795630 RepID=UPI0019513C26|nr:hypothetical protein [Frondihabitans sp. PAMC 28766]